MFFTPTGKHNSLRVLTATPQGDYIKSLESGGLFWQALLRSFFTKLFSVVDAHLPLCLNLGRMLDYPNEREHLHAMNTAYLGLGSNLGNRLAFLRGGRDILINQAGIELIQASGVYETEAIGGPPDNPLFLNAVLQVQTSLELRQLLEACLETENEFGRSRTMRWAPRTLDIDILFYDDQVLCEDHLTVPHPRLQERAFVLAPLLEIAPDLKHPLLDQTIAELAASIASIAELVPLRTSW